MLTLRQALNLSRNGRNESPSVLKKREKLEPKLQTQIKSESYNFIIRPNLHNISNDFTDSFLHSGGKEKISIPLEGDIADSSSKRKREDAKSTPKNEDFLPDFGCNKGSSAKESKKIKSENRTNSHGNSEKISLTGKSRRESSKRLSFDVKFKTKDLAEADSLKMMSSPNSSRERGKSKEK